MENPIKHGKFHKKWKMENSVKYGNFHKTRKFPRKMEKYHIDIGDG